MRMWSGWLPVPAIWTWRLYGIINLYTSNFVVRYEWIRRKLEPVYRPSIYSGISEPRLCWSDPSSSTSPVPFRYQCMPFDVYVDHIICDCLGLASNPPSHPSTLITVHYPTYMVHSLPTSGSAVLLSPACRLLAAVFPCQEPAIIYGAPSANYVTRYYWSDS